MRVALNQRHDGKWQADVVLPDGRDFHAVGREPWEALIELGLFWQGQRKTTDLDILANVLLESTKEQPN